MIQNSLDCIWLNVLAWLALARNTAALDDHQGSLVFSSFFRVSQKNTSCFHMTLTDDIWTNREMLSSLDVFAEWSRITLTHITADWRLQRNQTLQTSWRNYTHHPPKAECLCIFKNLEAKKILHIELSRRRCCCARKRGTLNGGYAHATSASFGPQRRDRATKQRAGNRHVNKKKHARAFLQ